MRLLFIGDVVGRFDHFAAGRASLVVGAHTQVPSADHRILSTAPASTHDVGVTGDYDSMIGMAKEEPVRRFTRRIPSGRFKPALEPVTLCGVAADIDPHGLTKTIAPMRIGGLLSAGA
jgi:hypothetical protein